MQFMNLIYLRVWIIYNSKVAKSKLHKKYDADYITMSESLY